MRVLLPAPFWPRRATTSPGRTSRSTPLRAWVVPNEHHRSRTDSAGEAALTSSRGAPGALSRLSLDAPELLPSGLVVVRGRDALSIHALRVLCVDELELRVIAA